MSDIHFSNPHSLGGSIAFGNQEDQEEAESEEEQDIIVEGAARSCEENCDIEMEK